VYCLENFSNQGCQIFLGNANQNGGNIPKKHQIYLQPGHKIYQMAVKRPNGHKIYQPLPMQDLPKSIQIGIFGLKKYHLATLFPTT
jgi:hypothetical protein